MSLVGRWKITGCAVATVATVIAGLGYAAAPVGAAQAAVAASSLTASGGVGPSAAAGTPQLNKIGAGKQNQEVIRELVQCGTTMYAVGRFTSIKHNGTIYTRDNIFSFSASAPYNVSSWAPNVNGQVNAIAFSGGNCADAYIGGQFTSINGTAVTNIAEIDTTTGNVVPAFGHSANFPVWTMVAVNGHLLVGGNFKFINGAQNPYLASLNPATGKDDGFIHLTISGDYHYCAAGGSPCTDPNNHTQVYNQQLSHNGTLDLVEGRFTSVGGLARQQIFMLNLAGSKATVTGWTSPEWDGSNTAAFPYYQCWPSLAFYIRSAAWSPDDSTVYLATTGYHPALINTNPRKGMCDSVSAFPATQTSVTHNWIEYSGCDSYYSVGADTGAVYAAGHPRWAMNNNGCNQAGAGSVADAGLQGFDPATGNVELNSGGTALYTMTRANADSMLITSAGLWIGSTNRYTINKCGNTTALHAGICFLRY
jgi:hypothetical protein